MSAAMWIIWLFCMGSHYIHSSANQWSAVTGSFKMGGHQPKKVCLPNLTVLNGLSLQTFITQSVTCCKWQFQMGGHQPKKVHLPNLNSFQVWLLLHQGLFYERPTRHLYSIPQGVHLPKYSSLPMLVDWYSRHLYSITWGIHMPKYTCLPHFVY